eukprot:CAMPEP_0196821210 /NCGR_PEP_ID=MMETSP1362-20130617/78218_1 /TAXON_ID=163516 /ORGANISM="Leptocylindrus danicus, Strain CCMP1856" /LENGTH=688 /DNA_ID=CAMNT_0042200323 /DNA_START=153 /DNA_END=2216 /DNA_ORIENTATION=+
MNNGSSLVFILPSLLLSSGYAQRSPREVLRRSRVYSDAYDELQEMEERARQASTDAFLAGLKDGPSYENHPYEGYARRILKEEHADRILMSADNARSDGRKLEDDVEETTTWASMRIKADVTALDGSRDGSAETDTKVNFIINEILPRTISYWQSALSVVPVKGNLMISTSELANRQYCGDSEFTEVPASHVTNGIPNTDLILYVSASDSTRFCPSGGDTLAVAVACNFDVFDRPIAGAINFCLSKIDSDRINDEATISDNVDVAIHETGHVLGMSGNSYKYFYDPSTGKPRTARPFKASTVTCVNNEQRTLVLPDENTMRFFIANSGQRYASIVTEKVATVARNQFNCQSVVGGQLENQPTGSSCHGDHWDESKFYPENLSGVVSSFNNWISPITLAIFEDSGWYFANYTFSEVSPWGHGAGCDFVEEPCIVGGQVPEYGRGYFCNEMGNRGCSADHTHKLACTMMDYSLRYPPDPPPSQFQYFDDPNKGGPRQADFCPVYGSTYGGKRASQLDCRVGGNSPSLNLYSESFGSASMCLETTTNEGRCYPAQCIYDERVLKVQLRGEWKTCEYDFQQLGLPSSTGFLGGSVICPRLASACPDLFCPKNCAGAGTCNFDNVVNGTQRPVCECFDETDTSPGCSETISNDGKYLEDSSRLSNNYKESWIDPLVAVFVDDPEFWTDASWGW